jgi:MinD superfamily P-loop ATPase
MKQLVVLGGKGGTGKTTVVAALAHLMAAERRLVLADADVDAPNLGLLLAPEVQYGERFTGGAEAVIDAEACIGCGRCLEVCRFEAVAPSDGVYAVDPIACEGCAACAYECPVQCITMEPAEDGEWYRSKTRLGDFAHARLFPGQENSGKLVSLVRHQAQLLAQEQGIEWVLVDGSPGIGCPVIAAVTGSDLALMVAEPTVSGQHDLDRVLGVAAHFRVPAAVVINKGGINPGRTAEIEAYCRERGLPMLGVLPYDDAAMAAMRRGRAVTEASDGPLALALRALWHRLRPLLGDGAAKDERKDS